MASPITVNSFSNDLTSRIKRMLDDYERGLPPTPLRRRRSVIGGDGGGCDKQNTVWHITIFGKPTSGNLILQVVVDGVSSPVTFSWTASAAGQLAALTTSHIKLTTSNTVVTGNGFPNSTMVVEFVGNLAGKDIALPFATWGGLDGGNGLGVLCSLAQKGHS